MLSIFCPGSVPFNIDVDRILDWLVYPQPIFDFLDIDGQAAYGSIAVFASAHVKYVRAEPQSSGDYLVQVTVNGMVRIA